MNYAQIRKLDEETLQQLTEGTGPSDKCLCSLLSPPGDEPKGLKASIMKAFKSFGPKKRKTVMRGQKSIDIPLSFTKDGKGIYSTKEVVKRNSSCSKCGCDNENIVLKHSFANIRITSPDVSSICPCPTDCLPDKQKIADRIKVTIERVTTMDVDFVNSEYSVFEADDGSIGEPDMERRSNAELVGEQWRDGESEWSSGEE